MINTVQVRSQFPAIANHPDIIYFDNAATTQKPICVLQSVSAYHHSYCSNAHRSTHDWGMQSTLKIHSVRKQVANFLQVNSHEDIFFTSGATHSSAFVALHFCQNFLNDGDEIITSKHEHKTLLSNWEYAIALTGKQITIRTIDLDPEGDYNIDSLRKIINQNTKLVLVTHIHNTFGIEMGIKEIRKVVPSTIPVIVDAAQSAGHIALYPEMLGVQGIYFSAHKMYGLSGIGVLWLEKKYQLPPMPLEEGTVNIEGIISLGAAIEYIESIGITTIEQHLLDLTQYALEQLRTIPTIEFLPGPALCSCATGYGILSFTMKNSSSNDVSQWLNEHQIYVRSGNQCSNSIIADNSIRLSFQIYNQKKEIDRLCDVLQQI